MLLLSAFMMLLAASLNANEELEWQEGDDEIMDATVGEMREALWYKENYYVQRILANTRLDIIQGYADLQTEQVEALYEAANRFDLLSDLGTVLKTAVVVVVAVVCTKIAIDAVVQIVSLWK